MAHVLHTVHDISSETMTSHDSRKDAMNELRYLSVSVAAKVLGVSVHTVYRAINNHELRWINIGTGTRPRVRIDENDLRAWMDARASSKAAS